MMYSLLNRVALAGATAGLTIATVLTVAHTNKTPLPCGLSSGCETVAQDPSSSFHGIPVSAFGIAAYIVLMICAILRIRGVALRPSSLLGLLVSLIGTGASAFLTYYSVTKIHATCQWCIGSAIMMVVSLVAYLATPKASEGVPETGKPITSVPWALLPVAIISTYAIFGHVTKEMPVDLSSVKLSSASLAVLERSSHALGGKTAQ